MIALIKSSTLSHRDRILIGLGALVQNGSASQLRSHLVLACDNGFTECELVEAIMHLVIYSDLEEIMSAVAITREVFQRPFELPGN